MFRIMITLIALVMLAGCGGGGNSATTSTNTPTVSKSISQPIWTKNGTNFDVYLEGNKVGSVSGGDSTLSLPDDSVGKKLEFVNPITGEKFERIITGASQKIVANLSAQTAEKLVTAGKSTNGVFKFLASNYDPKTTAPVSNEQESVESILQNAYFQLKTLGLFSNSQDFSAAFASHVTDCSNLQSMIASVNSTGATLASTLATILSSSTAKLAATTENLATVESNLSMMVTDLLAWKNGTKTSANVLGRFTTGLDIYLGCPMLREGGLLGVQNNVTGNWDFTHTFTEALPSGKFVVTYVDNTGNEFNVGNISNFSGKTFSYTGAGIGAAGDKYKFEYFINGSTTPNGILYGVQQ